MDALKRVEQMELNMNEMAAYLKKMEQLIDEFHKSHEQFVAFRDYYGSNDWHNDRELPLDNTIKCGVLSEDLPYNAIINYREVAISMLEVATKMLKDY